jgi:hypothetical protein
MPYLQIILPITLLVLSFLLKLLIDRSASLPRLIEGGFELPVDITFLSLSFIIAFTISFPQKAAMGLTIFILFLSVTVLLIFAWRRSVFLYENDHHIWSVILGVLCFMISVGGLVFSIRLISGG